MDQLRETKAPQIIWPPLRPGQSWSGGTLMVPFWGFQSVSSLKVTVIVSTQSPPTSVARWPSHLQGQIRHQSSFSQIRSQISRNLPPNSHIPHSQSPLPKPIHHSFYSCLLAFASLNAKTLFPPIDFIKSMHPSKAKWYSSALLIQLEVISFTVEFS